MLHATLVRSFTAARFVAKLKCRESSVPVPKARAVPTDHGVRLRNRQRLENTRHQTIQPNKDQAIHGTEGQSVRQMPALDVELMPKDQDLGFQRGPRPEQ